MHKRVATAIALAMCTPAIVVPIAAAPYLARQQSMQQASVQALALAGELLHRADTAGEQAIAAYERLRRSDTTGPCSDEKRAQLREVIMDYSYLQAIGFVSNDHVACSAIGPRGDGIDLGPPSYIGAMGARIRISAALGGNQRFLVMEKGGFAAALHPEALLDVSTGIPDLSLGVYGSSARLPWAHRGTLDPAWMATLRPGEQKVFFRRQESGGDPGIKKARRGRLRRHPARGSEFTLALLFAHPASGRAGAPCGDGMGGDIPRPPAGFIALGTPRGTQARGVRAALSVDRRTGHRPHGRGRGAAALACQQ